MDPHDHLIADHNTLRSQAGHLNTLVGGDAETLGGALENFQAVVQKHFQQEDVYFRTLDDGNRIPVRGLVHQLRNDHAAVVFTLESLSIRLRKYGMNDDWRGRFNNLMNVLLPHLDQEENHLFPLGRSTLSAGELARITQVMQDSE